MKASDAALCTSGTAVIQLQLARVPSVVAYRANPFTEWLIKSRTKLAFISLPNILLNSPVIPEALFVDCTPEKLASLLQ
jgi:lipid-A-disaccharide synthase